MAGGEGVQVGAKRSATTVPSVFSMSIRSGVNTCALVGGPVWQHRGPLLVEPYRHPARVGVLRQTLQGEVATSARYPTPLGPLLQRAVCIHSFVFLIGLAVFPPRSIASQPGPVITSAQRLGLVANEVNANRSQRRPGGVKRPRWNLCTHVFSCSVNRSKLGQSGKVMRHRALGGGRREVGLGGYRRTKGSDLQQPGHGRRPRGRRFPSYCAERHPSVTHDH